jgi:hypothetical protein
LEIERTRAEILERRLEEAQQRAARRAEFERQLSALRIKLSEMRAVQRGRPIG